MLLIIVMVGNSPETDGTKIVVKFDKKKLSRLFNGHKSSTAHSLVRVICLLFQQSIRECTKQMFIKSSYIPVTGLGQ